MCNYFVNTYSKFFNFFRDLVCFNTNNNYVTVQFYDTYTVLVNYLLIYKVHIVTDLIYHYVRHHVVKVRQGNGFLDNLNIHTHSLTYQILIR